MRWSKKGGSRVWGATHRNRLLEGLATSTKGANAGSDDHIWQPFWVPSLTCVARRQKRSAAGRRRRAPDGVPDVIGNQQCAGLVDGDPDRPAASLIVAVKKADHHILRHSARLAVAEGDKHDFVAVQC